MIEKTNTIKKKKQKLIIGWQEWCTFPDLDLPAVKAKIDTGAKTSAIHAYDFEPFQKDGQDFIRFKVHPIAADRVLFRQCEAPLVDYRSVKSSNGKTEKRYVIRTTFKVGNIQFISDMTLTSRYGMSYRMLLGKEAVKKGRFLVDVSKSYVFGKQINAKDLYQ